jgi:hypothetical protein
VVTWLLLNSLVVSCLSFLSHYKLTNKIDVKSDFTRNFFFTKRNSFLKTRKNNILLVLFLERVTGGESDKREVLKTSVDNSVLTMTHLFEK